MHLHINKISGSSSLNTKDCTLRICSFFRRLLSNEKYPPKEVAKNIKITKSLLSFILCFVLRPCEGLK